LKVVSRSDYWNRWNSRRYSRRSALGAAAVGSAGLTGLALVGCGDDDDDDDEGGEATATTTSTSAPGTQQVSTATATATEGVEKGGTLRTGTWLNVLGIDPHIEVSVGLGTAQKMYTYLGGFESGTQTFHPLAADSVEQASDTEFIFKLRDDVKFANKAPMNGRVLTAEDVLYSFERFRDLPQAQNNDFFKTVVDKMTVIDATTFSLTTKLPWAEAYSEIGGIQKAIVGREDVEQRTDLSTGGVGAGPFILTEYVKGEKSVLVKNPDYFETGLPHLDGIDQITILDLNTLLQAYKGDQIDINGALLTKLDYEDLERNSDLVNIKMPALHYGSFAMNVSIEPWNDIRVREAVYIGIDRAQFIDKVFQNEATPQGVLSNGLDYWVLPQDELKEFMGPDIQRAKDLLSAAGHANGLDITIETSNGVQLYIDHAEVLVEELKKIGINATLNLSDLPTYLSTKLFAGDFPSTVFTHNPYETPKIPLGFYHKLGLGNGSWWHYDNAEITAIIDKQAQELDVEERKQTVLEAQRMILADWAPMLNFASPTLFLSHHKRVGGYDPTLRGWQGFRHSEFLNKS
jgi:peptide/nickel transport system substrate-binding protein